MNRVDPTRTALLALDFQSTVVDNYFPGTGTVKHMAGAIDRARAAGVTIVFVTVAFRPGYPEIHERNPVFGGFASSGGLFVEGASGTEIHPDLPLRPDDLVVVKRRMSAFSGTELDHLLRTKSIDTLILGGLATSGVVLSTVRAAGDLDYALFVLGDCCADFDDEVQRVLLEKVLPFQATMISSDGLADILPPADPGGRTAIGSASNEH